MALRGTLADFGLPDIFQLVGHQQKTGVLLLKDRDIEVRISFVDGQVVKAEQSARGKTDLLGALMVRGGILTEEQLEEALRTQKKTLKRLGDILVETEAITRATLRELTRLQTTETIYRLFMWRKGTYEFTPGAVDYDVDSYEPIRAENILMEGFRMVDEWPSVRKHVPSTEVRFNVLRDLPPPAVGGSNNEDLLAGLEEAFGDDSPGSDGSGPPPRKVGDVERRIFPLVKPERTVQDIIDLSRLGEFETSKALATLVQNGHLAIAREAAAAPLQEQSRLGPVFFGFLGTVTPVLTRVALYAVVAAAVGAFVRVASSGPGVFAPGSAAFAQPDTLREHVGFIHRERIVRALEVYRLERGVYPEALVQLVNEDLLAPQDLTMVYRNEYAYRRNPVGYSLSRPLR